MFLLTRETVSDPALTAQNTSSEQWRFLVGASAAVLWPRGPAAYSEVTEAAALESFSPRLPRFGRKAVWEQAGYMSRKVTQTPTWPGFRSRDNELELLIHYR